MSLLSPERLNVVYQSHPTNARKKSKFLKNFLVPKNGLFDADFDGFNDEFGR
jgi:hypothetical protein